MKHFQNSGIRGGRIPGRQQGHAGKPGSEAGRPWRSILCREQPHLGRPHDVQRGGGAGGRGTRRHAPYSEPGGAGRGHPQHQEVDGESSCYFYVRAAVYGDWRIFDQ
jgi:hypothetical protein